MTICIDKFEPADMHLPVAQPPAVRFMRRKISDFARRGRIIEMAESFPNRLLEFRASSPDGAFSTRSDFSAAFLRDFGLWMRISPGLKANSQFLNALMPVLAELWDRDSGWITE